MAQIHEAADRGDVTQVRSLIARGTDVNQPADDGWPALSIAALQGHTAVAACLIEHGANVNATAPGGFGPLFVAAQGGHLAIVELLVANGAELEACSDDGGTALYNAALNGHRAVVEFLAGAGADVDARANNQGTPLGIAAEQGHPEVAGFLIKKGAEIDAANNDGFTPLHMAAQQGHGEVADLLIANGADVDARNHAGSTPGDVARLHGHAALVERIGAQRGEEPSDGVYCTKCHRGVIMSWTCPQCGKLFCDTCSGMTSAAPEIHEGFTVQTLGGNTPTCPSCKRDTGQDELEEEIREVMRQGKKIAAIKLYRARTGVSLMDAKEAMDAFCRSGSLPPAPAREAPVADGDEEIWEAMRQGQKILAIKLYRERAGVGLKEAKEAIEAMWDSAPPCTASPRDTCVEETEILKLLRNRGQVGHIEAVRLWHERTGHSLRASTEAVNRVARKHGIPVEESNCFIATACYGDPLCEDVWRLRCFRDEELAAWRVGRGLVAIYYALSPPVAGWLRSHSTARTWTRRLLVAPIVSCVTLLQGRR